MKTKPTLTIATLLVMVILAISGLFRGTQSTRAESVSPEPSAVFPLAAPTPDYTVLPSDTDEGKDLQTRAVSGG